MNKMEALDMEIEMQDALVEAMMLGGPYQRLLARYFDLDNTDNMQKKVTILKRIANGDDVGEEELFSILDKAPKGKNIMWD